MPALHRLAIVSRLLLALLPTGLVKLLGQRFTTLGVDTGPGAFFEAMYQTGFYWNAIGLGRSSRPGWAFLPGTRDLGVPMPVALAALVGAAVAAGLVGVGWAVAFIRTNDTAPYTRYEKSTTPTQSPITWVAGEGRNRQGGARVTRIIRSDGRSDVGTSTYTFPGLTDCDRHK